VLGNVFLSSISYIDFSNGKTRKHDHLNKALQNRLQGYITIPWTLRGQKNSIMPTASYVPQIKNHRLVHLNLSDGSQTSSLPDISF